MVDLVTIVPSRGRPQAAKELAQTFTDLCIADTQLVFAVDSDDPTLSRYSDSTLNVLVCGPWQPMVPKLNQVAVAMAVAADAPFALAFMGDDHRPRTPGWDSRMLTVLREVGTGVAYGDDLLQRERLCTSWMMTTDIVQALGRMVPAPVDHMACDNSVMAVAREADCLRYLPEVVIEHMHPLAGKAEWDPGYVRVNRAEQYRKDLATFVDWQRSELVEDVAKVRELRSG